MKLPSVMAPHWEVLLKACLRMESSMRLCARSGPRVARAAQSSEHFAALRREAVAIPAARRAGVHTPELVEIDDTCELLPCPFAIYRRVHGETLESLELSATAAAEVWRELGRELARLHAVVPDGANRSMPPPGPLPDPRELVDAHAQAGWFTRTESRWLLKCWGHSLRSRCSRPGSGSFAAIRKQATSWFNKIRCATLP
jgi:Phosphotransferase enzyme family